MKKYNEMKNRTTFVADMGMRTLFSEGFVKMPAQNIIEIVKLIKGLREIDVAYSMRVIKDESIKSMAYEFYFPNRIEGIEE